MLGSGTRQHAEDMRSRVAGVLAPMGLRLSAEKTKITHIDEGLDFLGWHIQRHRKRGTDRQYVYTYPSRKALRAVMGKVKEICRKSVNLPLPALLHRLNPVLRGWCAYFRPGVSSATFQHLGHCAWQRVIGWAQRKHHKANWKTIRRPYCRGG
ncbi:group II intron maturase-specific domain-containing protein [Streptomyces sp. CA-251387]|uniref:group II intron maturase-specific domain-containing protein n=1 Tax=Streptomyces sp. CA-251387 TaxID=3240064 RepID=UPI003D925989